jgi:hypothetical protein
MSRGGRRDLVIGLGAGAVLGLVLLPFLGLDRWSTLAQGLFPLAVTSPPAGARLSGSVVVSAVSGSPDIEGIQFQIGGVNLGPEITQGPCSAVWNTVAGSDGQYTVTAIARDATGRRFPSIPVQVVVNNSGQGSVDTGTGTRRSRLTAEQEKGRVEGGERGRRTGAGPESKGGGGRTGATPRPCTTPNPYVNVPGITGVCVDGIWMAIKAS